MSTGQKAAYQKYRQFHIWMLVPFFISMLGFSYSYFFKLSEATFHQHVHGISAMLWYILVIVQPYLITRKKDLRSHRKLGVLGVILAGIVAGSALTIIPMNIDNVSELDVNGFFNPTFAYFATVIDLLLIGMFILSVSLAVLSIKEKKLADHVQWLMASIFFVLSPALLRMLGIGAIFLNEGSVEGITMVQLAIPSLIGMTVLIITYYYKFGSFKHLSFKLLMASHVMFLFIEGVGNNGSVRKVLDVIFSS